MRSPLVASKAMSAMQSAEAQLQEEDTPSSSSSPKAKSKALLSPPSAKASNSPRDFKSSSSEYLHVGPVLGALPSLGPGAISSPRASAMSPISRPFGSELDSLLDNREDRFFQNDTSKMKKSKPSRQADDKKPKKKNEPAPDTLAPDTPAAYVCQLTRQLMTEPVKSMYGHVYEKSAIMQWFSQQGRICPLTGAPLSDTNLSPMPELAEEIRAWILKKSLGGDTNKTAFADAKSTEAIPTAAATVKTKSLAVSDDLYEF
jgi:hypothetical protein